MGVLKCGHFEDFHGYSDFSPTFTEVVGNLQRPTFNPSGMKLSKIWDEVTACCDASRLPYETLIKIWVPLNLKHITSF